MVFSSVIFLFGFIPVFLVLYFIVPGLAAKNIILLLFSLVFYAWGEPVYIVLMLASIVANWIFGLAVGANSSPAKRKLFRLIANASANWLG